MKAPQSVRDSAARLMPVARVIASGYVLIGNVSQKECDAAEAIVAAALDNGLTRDQCLRVHDLLQDGPKKMWAITLCDMLNMKADLDTVLDWVISEVEVGGTAPVVATPVQAGLDERATCWLFEDLGDLRRTLRMFCPGYDDAAREGALRWLTSHGYGLAWVALSVEDGSRTNRGNWTYSHADRERVRHWLTAAQAMGLKVAAVLGLNHSTKTPQNDAEWVATVMSDLGDLFEHVSVRVEVDEGNGISAGQASAICRQIQAAGGRAAIHCEREDSYASYGREADILQVQYSGWQGGINPSSVAATTRRFVKQFPGKEIHAWEFAYGDDDSARALGDAALGSGAVVAAPCTPRKAVSAAPVNANPDLVDDVDVSKLGPWGDNKPVVPFRSASADRNKLHLDYDDPHWPDRNEHITMTWVAVQVVNGKAVKMGKFEHGRPSDKHTRDTSALLGSRPGFEVKWGDTVAVMAVPCILGNAQPDERTPARLIRWEP